MGTFAGLTGWDPDLFIDPAGSRIEISQLTGPLVPRAFGGAGLSAVQASEMLDRLGQGTKDPGTAMAVAVHAVLATVPLRAFGTDEQRQRYLPRVASGDWIGAVSMRQRQGAALGAAVEVRGDSNGWALDGVLDQVVNAPAAHHFLIMATHPDGARSAFVVDRDTPGLRIEAPGPSATAAGLWGRVHLSSCAVPHGAVLGTPRAARTEVEPLLAALDGVFTSAPWVGLARSLLHEALENVRVRTLFGRPLVNSQSVRFVVADMATTIELAAGLVARGAEGLDAGGSRSYTDAAVAKLFVADSLREVLAGAMRISDVGVEGESGSARRIQRDADFFSVTGWAADVLRPVVAASVLELG